MTHLREGKKMLAEIIPKIAAMENEEYDFRPRPSLAGPERCIRQMVMWGLGIPRSPMPGRAIMIFSDSSWHEELTADWLRKTAYQVHSQQMTVQCRPPMGKGKIDGILTDMNRVDRLWEHKAISHFSFQRLWEGPLPLDYLTQTAIYLDALKEETDIEEAILLFKNKNTAQFIEYRVRYEWDVLAILEMVNSQGEHLVRDGKDYCVIHDIYQNAIDKFNEVLERIEGKNLPKRQYEQNDWHCEYCGWYEECWKNYHEEFAELKTDLIFPEEFATDIRFYRELGGQESDIKKQREEVKKVIIKKMKEADAREGRAEEYIVRLKLEERKEFTVPANTIEKLYVSKIKEKRP